VLKNEILDSGGLVSQRIAILVLVILCARPPRSLSEPAEVDTLSSQIETFELESKVFNNTRTIRVFLPDDYKDPRNSARKYAVFYMNDGFAVFNAKAWNAPQTISALIGRKAIEPIILVGIDNGASIENGSILQRTNEYLPYADLENEPDVPNPHGSDYPKFLINEVMPEMAKRYRVAQEPKNTGLGGSSYGGMAALYTVMHNPKAFGRLLLESTPVFMADFAALKEAQQTKDWPARVYIGIGTKEASDPELSSKAAQNVATLKAAIGKNSPRSVIKVVVQKGATHGSDAWRTRLPNAVTFLWRR
jgi:predicted alpha/beta superfamily hydrolase